MAVSFEPQFHKRVNRNQEERAWIALPHPRTLVPVKSMFYRQWQFEERVRLQEAGEIVLHNDSEE
ncbi:hypothetical protein EDC30_106184 [Paucimonas lemoignei]|uniref:Uncharacterized protein n=1 Tax=Paucimonas lemoignei TaxID=29443 RepID=A0A4R3HU70_PAULE|nr:hypothetical protein [Paucimonas lemoignei]TCS36642.1 hypothetical protein EDC30_106184 [Paucimonas lemoignei]